MNENQTPVIWTIIIAALLMIAVVSIGGIAVSNRIGDRLDVMNAGLSGLSIDEQAMATNIANGIVAGITLPEAPVYPEFPEYMISEEDYEKNLQEAEALRLATEEVESSDFEELVYDALVLIPSTDDGAGIEDEDDITEIRIVDSEVILVGESSDVTFDVKVYYFIDGDEEEDFRARLLTFTVDVDELVIDDDFEDAEAELPASVAVDTVY